MSTGIMWFRRDLRVTDNPAWNDACQTHDDVVALYVLEPALMASSHRRAARLIEELRCLDATLAALGGCLRVEMGPATERVLQTAIDVDATDVHLNLDVGPFATSRDRAVETALAQRGIGFRGWWGSLYHRPGDVLTGRGTLSQVFTPFSKVWAATTASRWPGPAAARVAGERGLGIPASDPVSTPWYDDPELCPGETAALDRLHAFATHADRYLDERDFPASNGTSRLSVDLRFGTLSPRTIAHAVGGVTQGRLGYLRQLAWRDWWAHTIHARPELVARPMQEKYSRIVWRDDPTDLAAWKAGRTGYPIVDAGMRELAATGWMHNRVRMITGSFLVKHLLVDWRRGEAHFRRALLDGDVAQNAGNWQWVAGTGPDAAPYFRVLNPIVQSERFDPDGEYITRWVPELAGLDRTQIHQPWDVPPLELGAAGVVLGDTYPHPIVDHRSARERALTTYKVAIGSA